jgi:hypothetical protein
MNQLQTYLDDVKKRADGASEWKVEYSQDLLLDKKTGDLSYHWGFEMPEDIGQLFGHAPTDLSVLLEMVEFQRDILEIFSNYYDGDESQKLFKKAMDKLNSLIPGGGE